MAVHGRHRLGHKLGLSTRDNRSNRFRYRGRYEARTHPQCSTPCQEGRTRLAAASGDYQHMAENSLVAIRGTPANEMAQLVCFEEQAGRVDLIDSSWGESNVRYFQPSAQSRTWIRHLTRLRKSKRNR
jgi:hypothetical protein